MRTRRKGPLNGIGGSYVSLSLEMFRSPAWTFLPDDARRFVNELEIEHMEHGAAENGRLQKPYSQLKREKGKPGIRKDDIPFAIRAAVELGFVKITGAGQRAISSVRAPALYQLTYLNGRGPKAPEATHDWQKIKTADDAHAALAKAAATKRYDTQSRTRRHLKAAES